MWNKKDEFVNPPSPEPLRASPPQPAAPASARAPVAVAASVIGPSVHVKGEVRSKEPLLVEGEIEGIMDLEGLLTVGASGKVRANIKAREVVIFGSVRGDVDVSGKIAIREQGSLVGNIKSAGIGIDDGAYFKGSIDIVRSDTKAQAKSGLVVEPKIVAPVG